MTLGTLALRVARSRPGTTLAWLALGPLRRVVPVRVLAEHGGARVFRHPRPGYATHLLVVPTKRVPDYLEATVDLLGDVLLVADQLTGEQPLQLVTNLGAYQEVKLLHFHLVPRTDGVPQGTAEAGQLASLLDATRSEARRAVATSGACRVILVPTSTGCEWRVVA